MLLLAQHHPASKSRRADPMTTNQADKLIKSGKPVTLYNKVYDETFTVTLVRRDRYNVYGDEGQVFNRPDLELRS